MEKKDGVKKKERNRKEMREKAEKWGIMKERTGEKKNREKKERNRREKKRKIVEWGSGKDKTKEGVEEVQPRGIEEESSE